MSTTRIMLAARGKIIFRLALKSKTNKIEYDIITVLSFWYLASILHALKILKFF